MPAKVPVARTIVAVEPESRIRSGAWTREAFVTLRNRHKSTNREN
jgi:hypothetical protein